MKKQILFISALILMIALSLSPHHIVQAESPAPDARTFTPLVYEPFSVTLEGACQATKTAIQEWLFGLPVTEDLLTELENSVADGNVAFVETRSMIDITIEGNGSAVANLNYELVTFDTSNSQETIQASAFTSITGPHHDGLRVALQLEEEVISGLEAGDVLLMEISIAMILRAEGCSPTGQAPAVTIRKKIDSSSPYLGFLAGDINFPIIVGSLLATAPE